MRSTWRPGIACGSGSWGSGLRTGGGGRCEPSCGAALGRVASEDYTEAHLQRVLALNVTQVALFMHEVVPVMRQQRAGNVINVSSIAARTGGGAGAILYAATKGFVSTATRG
jgi:3-oxoacyl-[acyl-carrier protein] reductase